MNRVIAFLILFLFIQPATACLILVIADGKQVLVGNHEDWYAQDSQVMVVPPTGKKYGFVGFGFASEEYIQGGMNTAGLFFDGTATPFVSVDFSDKPAYTGYLWQAILENCATVEEAVAFVKTYKVPDLQKVHVSFADKRGNSVIIGAYEGELTYHYRNNQSYQLLTNFNITNPEYGNEPVCQRFQKANLLLQKDSAATVSNITHILSQTHQQELTVYSTIYDLTRGEVYVFNKADFSRSVKLNLANELQKGKQQRLLPYLFK
ncbi:linear amide C-N hydrolase [Rhodocytophaga rosea]|uniref:Linear amide C-N hydrolase n=1 Tax=Rhodocytophaga rosea TaxID=2704465 RepID=A0A6C0GKT5_9BACT|nr:linear amide C-N hydrolase [Rhodocytophaga rosea]QHT68557.1 linear amide C-N hydrolase [Rhodocytophaga rosea]